MDERHDENVHFKMRLDEAVEDAVIPTQVDELRIEKLNHRMTLISILIPVLIVVILGVAYLDIKRRVIRTEDTGAVTAQHLSEDLESRFSSLSLNQAHVEEALAKLQDQTNQSLAKAQVNLQKLDDSLKQTRAAMASQKEVKSMSNNMEQSLANVAKSVEELNVQVDALAQTLQTRLIQVDQQTAEQRANVAEFKETLLNLEQNKIDKAALDLALKLEALKIKQAFSVQLDDVQARLRSVEQKVENRSAVQSPTVPSSLPPKVLPPKSVPSAPEPGKLQEQTIGK